MILKLQCHSCEYDLVQDTKRDPRGAMLEICREIHQNTYKNHVLEILEVSRDELELLVVSKHPKMRHQHHHQHHRKESRSAIFEIMHDLAKMERHELESLWVEYGAKE